MSQITIILLVLFAGITILVIDECMKTRAESKEDLMVKRLQYEEKVNHGDRQHL